MAVETYQYRVLATGFIGGRRVVKDQIIALTPSAAKYERVELVGGSPGGGAGTALAATFGTGTVTVTSYETKGS